MIIPMRHTSVGEVIIRELRRNVVGIGGLAVDLPETPPMYNEGARQSEVYTYSMLRGSRKMRVTDKHGSTYV